MSSYDRIAWIRWNKSGVPGRTSAAHIEDENNPNRTVCGRTIPQEGNGVQHENGADANATDCKRCDKIERETPRPTCGGCGHMLNPEDEGGSLCLRCDS